MHPTAILPGEDLVITGSRFPANVPVTARMGAPFSGRFVDVATGETSADGTLEIRFPLPDRADLVARPRPGTVGCLAIVVFAVTERGPVGAARGLLYLGP
ncbi:MAG: hypothetical protein U0360_10455 [Dehalococcoidia bacterium]